MTNASMIYEQPQNISSSPEFFIQFLNSASNGTWSMALIGLSFGIPFLALMNYNPRQAFAAAAFNGLMTSILLAGFGVVSSFVYTLMAVLVAVGVILNQ